MARIEAFEKYYLEYEEWFEKNHSLYQTELKTLKTLVDNVSNGLEIGIGTGKFALPIGVKTGIEPSKKMREIALLKGLKVLDAVAENLPFENDKFNFATMITTVCFVDDLLKSFQEAFRVIKQNGFLIVGYVDKNSKLGIEYQQKSQKSKFYKSANFYATDEIIRLLKLVGFSSFELKYVENTQQSFLFLKSFKL